MISIKATRPWLVLACLLACSPVVLGQRQLWSSYYHSSAIEWDYPVRTSKVPDGSMYLATYSAGASTLVKLGPGGAETWRRVVPGQVVKMDANAGGASVLSKVRRLLDGFGTLDTVIMVRFDALGNRTWSIQESAYLMLADHRSMIGLDSSNNTYVLFSDRGYTGFRKIGPDGTILASKRLVDGQGAYLSYNSIWSAATHLNGITVAGSASQGGANYRSVFLRFNTVGDIVWTRSYDGPEGFDDLPTWTQVAPDGSFFVNIETYTLDANKNPVFVADRIASYDQAGNRLMLGALPKVMQVNGIASKSGLTVVSGIDTVTYNLAIRGVNGSGQLIVNRTFPSVSHGMPNSIVFDANNFLYLGGSSDLDLRGVIFKLYPSGATAWSQTFRGSGPYRNAVDGLLLDAGNRVVCTARVYNQTTHDDVAVLGYDSNGALLYRKDLDFGLSPEETQRSITDSAGNTFVASVTSGGQFPRYDFEWLLTKFGPGGYPLWTKRGSLGAGGGRKQAAILSFVPGGMMMAVLDDAPTNPKAYVLKFDLNGNQLWANSPPVAGWTTVVAVDRDGGSYLLSDDLSGTFASTGTSFVAGIQPSGAVSYSKSYMANFKALAAVTDNAKNLYVAGLLSNPTNLIKVSTLLKLRPDGTLAWQKSLGAEGSVDGDRVCIALAPSGRIAVGRVGVAPPSVSLFDLEGNKLWAVNPGLAVRQVKFDPFGNVVAAGSIGSYGNVDIGVSRIATNGALLWIRSYDRSPYDVSRALEVDPLGFIVVAGISRTIEKGHDQLTIKYTPSGALVWLSNTGPFENGAAIYNDSWNLDDEPVSIGFDANANVYVAGRSYGPSATADVHAILYASGYNPPDNARLISQTIPPSAIAGQTFNVAFTIKNTGTTTWSLASGYQLVCLEGSTWGVPSVPLAASESIGPGQSKTFSFTVTASTTGAANVMQWRMAKGPIHFGEPTSLVGVAVTTG